jgi:hypothetical protein
MIEKNRKNKFIVGLYEVMKEPATDGDETVEIE